MQKRQHLGEKEIAILNYFYENKSGHFRGILRSLGMYEHTLQKYLASLERDKLVISKKVANLKIYELRLDNPIVRVFYSYFDLLRLNSIEFGRKMSIIDFVSGFKKIRFPLFIFVFGSTATGNYRKDSDVDIIVVCNSVEDGDVRKVLDLCDDIRAVRRIHVSPIVMDLNEFVKEKANKENYALQSALIQSLPVFGNLSYYDIVSGGSS